MVEDDKSKIPLYNKFTSKIFKKLIIILYNDCKTLYTLYCNNT